VGVLIAALPGAAATARIQDDGVVAVIGEETVTAADVRELASESLEGLEHERLRFEADARSREYGILEDTLNGMITDRVLGMESESRGMSVDELLASEVESRIVEPSESEIQNVYQANLQQLISLPRAEGLARVRQFLLQQSYDVALVDYVEGLREAYGVDSRMEPYRVEVETDGYPTRGSEDAPIVMVEFSDFECPFCRQTLPILEDILDTYGDQIRFVYRQFPLADIHPRAQKAAEASLCADEQGEFWRMHDLLFAEPIELEVASIKVKAESLGLDRTSFDACLDSGKYADRVEDEMLEGFRVGVTGTPTLIINGRVLVGAQPYDAYAGIIEDELERVRVGSLGQ